MDVRVRTPEGRFVCALLANDEQRKREYEESGEDMASTGVTSASFIVACRRLFSTDTDVRDITAYVRVAADRLKAAGEEVNRRVVEAAIRSALGEPTLVNGVGTEELFETHVLLLQLMVDDLGLTGPRLVDLVSEAEVLAEAIFSTNSGGK